MSKYFIYYSLFVSLATGLSSCKLQSHYQQETAGGWIKYDSNPVLGGDLGTIFDISVLHDQPGKFQMYCSWRPQRSIALSASTDGLHWTKPEICLQYNDSSGWERDVNRPVVIYKDGKYHMWYTGENDSASAIGYAVSDDGKQFIRTGIAPVMKAEQPWEKKALMCPHVIWDETQKIFRMWYSGGEQYEPDAIGYATSPDGIHWSKYAGNPIFRNNKNNLWEQDKVTACQVIRRKDDYLMFYIGFKNIDYAQIGMARSRDGINNWERYPDNPIIKPGKEWDSSAVYKPYAVQDGNRWLLYYNGRRNNKEQIGIAIHQGLNLGF
ncbi:MAG: family 43 glycosylhydrolase [Bacteroidota bacterium]|nr:family 43 glycosylhydrolase [Bacteroidota bacterium]MDP4248962.1 family 43 glycosylhydrolase [Bacteroidota bacterium]